MVMKRSINDTQIERDGVYCRKCGVWNLYYKEDGYLYDYATCHENDEVDVSSLTMYIHWTTGDSDLISTIRAYYMITLLHKYDITTHMNIRDLEEIERLADEHIKELLNS